MNLNYSFNKAGYRRVCDSGVIAIENKHKESACELLAKLNHSNKALQSKEVHTNKRLVVETSGCGDPWIG